MNKISYLSLILLSFLGLSACNCPDIDPYHELTSIELDPLDANGTSIAKNNYSKDTLLLQLTLGSRFISHLNHLPFKTSSVCHGNAKMPNDGPMVLK